MQRTYKSCIKINGIPLLPPLMTDNVKEEMKHYKTLAVELEEKLRVRQLVKCAVKGKDIQANTMESTCKLKSFIYNSDNEPSNHNTMSDSNNSDSYSKATTIERIPYIEKPLLAEETKDQRDARSPMLEVQNSQFQTCLANNIVDDVKSVDAIISQSQHVDTIEAKVSNQDAMLLESWKPEVPRTLDVVPIILNDPKPKENNIDSLVVESKESEDPPKLSRQASYVLDTPSPVLLACMNTEFVNGNYIPTPTIDMPQRKRWDITQHKVEWEKDQFVPKDTMASDKLERVAHESNSRHTKLDIFTESYQTDKSIDNAQVAFTKERMCRSDIMPIKHNHTPSTDLKSQSWSEKLRRDSSASASNVADELQEFVMGVSSSSETQSSRTDGNEHRDDTKNISRKYQDPNTAQSSVTSEKLLTVYKEIEEMHKKQMMELIHRQRKEQSLLQAEFQKQQTLLLAEIQRCSSGVSYRTDGENVALNHPSLSDETKLRETEVSEMGRPLNVNSLSNLDAEVYRSSKLSPADRINVVVCPLDYISSKHLYLPKYYKPLPAADTSSAVLSSGLAKKVNLNDSTRNDSNNSSNNSSSNNNNNNNYDNDSNKCELHDRIAYKNSSVNRRLFPLDSNTTHMPVLDTSAYFEKHVRAVNIINAYARGYLARRLMRTERVITLKKIYKEALQCMLKLHVDAPLNLAEVNFLHRLQLQCDAASMNLVELFAQSPAKRMKVIAQDREIKQSRTERPTSARSYSFATQKTLARKNLKEFESTMTKYQRPSVVKKNMIRSRCQTWTSENIRERLVSPSTLRKLLTGQGIRRSTSAGTVRKPWR